MLTDLAITKLDVLTAAWTRLRYALYECDGKIYKDRPRAQSVFYRKACADSSWLEMRHL